MSSVSTTPFNELKSRFAQPNVKDVDVLRHCLGLRRIRMKPSKDYNVSQSRSIADQLAEHTVMICIDTEHYTLNSDEMTEIGIAIMDTQHVLPLSQSGNFGEHGEHLLRKVRYHFFRLCEKAHLPTTNSSSRGPAGNRFGEVRFVTFSDARKYLRKLLVQSITQVPALQGYNRPIVILGHSIGHDREHLSGKDLGFELDRLGTIVRYIDTQQVAIETRRWFHIKNPIGLKLLVDKLEYEHIDPHTAANDTGRTMMSAVLMVLPKKARIGCGRSIQQVATNLEHLSRIQFVAMGGTKRYCCQCGSTDHMGTSCPKAALDSLRCEECVSRGLDVLSKKHITAHCTIVRDEVAAERLVWYAGQRKDWSPKFPFSSRDRLQAFAENAPRAIPATQEEVSARRKWYDREKANPVLEPFIWFRRSFEQSPLRFQGPPKGSRAATRSAGATRLAIASGATAPSQDIGHELPARPPVDTTATGIPQMGAVPSSQTPHIMPSLRYRPEADPEQWAQAQPWTPPQDPHWVPPRVEQWRAPQGQWMPNHARTWSQQGYLGGFHAGPPPAGPPGSYDMGSWGRADPAQSGYDSRVHTDSCGGGRGRSGPGEFSNTDSRRRGRRRGGRGGGGDGRRMGDGYGRGGGHG